MGGPVNRVSHRWIPVIILLEVSQKGGTSTGCHEWTLDLAGHSANREMELGSSVREAQDMSAIDSRIFIPQFERSFVDQHNN